MTAVLISELNTRGAVKQNPKIGVSGFAKRAINKLYQRLLSVYGGTVQLNVIDGDTSATSVAEIQKNHQEEKDRAVISFVTGAGAYGLSLPSDSAWNFPSWNAAKAGQFAARFHRHPTQPCDLTTILPTGISEYQVELSKEKEKIGLSALAELARFEDEDSDFENDNSISPGLLKSLIDKLYYYEPEVR